MYIRYTLSLPFPQTNGGLDRVLKKHPDLSLEVKLQMALDIGMVVLRVQAFFLMKYGTVQTLTLNVYFVCVHCSHKQQYMKMYYTHAARGVAYLHSFSPPILHRDLKPSNW